MSAVAEGLVRRALMAQKPPTKAKHSQIAEPPWTRRPQRPSRPRCSIAEIDWPSDQLAFTVSVEVLAQVWVCTCQPRDW